MTTPRIVIYGNAGSGKSTLARTLAAQFEIPHLSLDDIAWREAAVRKPVTESLAELEAFVATHPGWVIEGCYGDLIAAALSYCTELHFLNPGVDECVARCRMRAWEPDKFPTPEVQNEMLAPLIDWVRQYETRDDEFSLARHRALFDGFTGSKTEHRLV